MSTTATKRKPVTRADAVQAENQLGELNNDMTKLLTKRSRLMERITIKKADHPSPRYLDEEREADSQRLIELDDKMDSLKHDMRRLDNKRERYHKQVHKKGLNAAAKKYTTAARQHDERVLSLFEAMADTIDAVNRCLPAQDDLERAEQEFVRHMRALREEGLTVENITEVRCMSQDVLRRLHRELATVPKERSDRETMRAELGIANIEEEDFFEEDE